MKNSVIRQSGIRNHQNPKNVDLIIERDINFENYLDCVDKLDKWKNNLAHYSGAKDKYNFHKNEMIKLLTKYLNELKDKNIDLDTRITKNDIYNQLTEVY